MQRRKESELGLRLANEYTCIAHIMVSGWCDEAVGWKRGEYKKRE